MKWRSSEVPPGEWPIDLLRRGYRIERQDSKLRVSPELLKCVGYLAEAIQLDSEAIDIDPFGTGFFIAIPSAAHPNKSFCAFVTARHLIADHKNLKLCLIVNGRSGQGIVVEIPENVIWWEHPSDKTADLVLMVFDHQPKDFDIISMHIRDFLTAERMLKADIGVGDEVFFPGLFTKAPGNGRMTPIVRNGNIALIPSGEIQVESSFADVYLVEAHSLGGMSGSPVFVRETVRIAPYTSDDTPSVAFGIGRLYLMGLMHGHWDINEADINKPSFVHDRPRGVNMGIAVVVPASKILDIVNRPELVASRARADARISEAISPGPDAV
ncbi:MAG: hypothetical protein M3O35_21625 [Acidobacteriota bacterium]|nr:hypothetical protein [Acidobacteriota bacterium]